MGGAEFDLKEWRALLKWIEQQLPVIAVEDALCHQESEGWMVTKRRRQRPQTRIPSNSAALEVSKLESSRRTSARNKTSGALSVLRPAHASKVGKVVCRKESRFRYQTNTFTSALMQSVQQAIEEEQRHDPYSGCHCNGYLPQSF